MTTRLSLLLASSFLAFGAGLPAAAATRGAPCATVCVADPGAGDGVGDGVAMQWRVSGDDDDDDDDDDGGWLRRWRGHDDDDDDDCDDDDDDAAGAAGGCAGQRNPAPAGTVAPPANGLFGTGTPPIAVTK